MLDTIKRYTDTMPTGQSARIALAELDLAAQCAGTEVRLVDGVAVTVMGGSPSGADRIGDDELRQFLRESVQLLDEPEEEGLRRMVA